MEPLLQIRDLVVHFNTDRGVVQALHEANLTIRRGEVVALVGESGCGKTTISRSILNIIPSPPGRIVKGEVFFRGRNILDLSEEECNSTIRGKAITLIPQDPFSSFNPLFTFGTQIWDIAGKELLKSASGPQRPSKRDVKARIVAMLTRVQLPSPESLLRKYPHEVSGGQRQRLMIATALLPNPELIIADEPTTALDVTIQAQIITLLKKLVTEEKVSVLYITHDLAVSSKIANRVVVMYAGQEVESAPRNEFFTSPVHPYTIRLLECLPRKGKAIEDIPGSVPSLINRPSGCIFQSRCEGRMDACACKMPALTEIRTGHWVRCHRFQ